jgi:hypothetical protein
MKKNFYLLATILLCSFANVQGAVGDTTWVQSFHGQFTNPGAFDTSIVFPNGTVTYRKIYMIITIGEYNYPGNPQYCHQ